MGRRQSLYSDFEEISILLKMIYEIFLKEQGTQQKYLPFEWYENKNV